MIAVAPIALLCWVALTPAEADAQSQREFKRPPGKLDLDITAPEKRNEPVNNPFKDDAKGERSSVGAIGDAIGDLPITGCSGHDSGGNKVWGVCGKTKF